jgi:hypothetical protein
LKPLIWFGYYMNACTHPFREDPYELNHNFRWLNVLVSLIFLTIFRRAPQSSCGFWF